MVRISVIAVRHGYPVFFCRSGRFIPVRHHGGQPYRRYRLKLLPGVAGRLLINAHQPTGSVTPLVVVQLRHVKW
jgi:hypothetical protein